MTPPDTTGAIGPSDYVEFVNSEVAAYQRTSLALVGPPVDLSTFTGGIAVCDPQIKYDPNTSRWFYVAIRCDNTPTENKLYVGFSKTSDPTDLSTQAGHGWCGYSYSTGKAFEDYPKLGLDPLHILIGTNSFNPEFVTAHILSLPKPTGTITECPTTAPTLTAFASKAAPLRTSVESHLAFTPEPATVADASSAGFVVAADFGNFGAGKNVMIWQVGGTAEAPELKALGAPAVTAFGLPPFVPQPGTSDELDSLDSRLTQAVAAADPNAGGEEAVWTQHTVAGGGGSVVRWYELLPGKLTARQTGTISEPGKFVFNGAIAPTLTGGAVIDYNTASASALVQIMAQSRVSSAPLGTMNTPILLSSSEAVDGDFSCESQTLEEEPCRWGDYAGASVDPINGNLVWGSNQTNGATPTEHQAQWATHNFALTPNDVAPAASFTISPNPATVASAAAFNGTGSSDPDGAVVAYDWNFGDGSAAASGASPSHIYPAPGVYTVTLTVTDNGGQTNAVSHQITVNTAPPPPTTTTTTTTTAASVAGSAPLVAVVPNSTFGSVGVSVDVKTGAITLKVSVADPGTFSWLLTFQNGKFGVFAASASKCKKGFIRLTGKCRPAKIVFAKGSRLVASAGTVNFTIKPSGSASKALKNALKQRKGVPVAATFTFKSSRGGSAVSHTQSLTVKRKK